MAISLNGSTQYLSASAIAVSSYPNTLVAYANPTVTNVDQYVHAHDNSASAIINGWKFRLAGLTGGTPVRMSSGDATNQEAVSTSTAFTTGWQKVIMINTNATSRSLYRDNAGLGSGSTSITPTGLNRSLIGVSQLLAAFSGFFNGSLAMVAGYSVAWSSTDRDMYQSGLAPWLIQKQALVFCLPLYDSAFGPTDIASNLTWTAQASPTYTASLAARLTNSIGLTGIL